MQDCVVLQYEGEFNFQRRREGNYRYRNASSQEELYVYRRMKEHVIRDQAGLQLLAMTLHLRQEIVRKRKGKQGYDASSSPPTAIITIMPRHEIVVRDQDVYAKATRSFHMYLTQEVSWDSMSSEEEARISALRQSLRVVRGKLLHQSRQRAFEMVHVVDDSERRGSEGGGVEAAAARVIQKCYRQRLVMKMCEMIDVTKYRHDSVRTRLREAIGRSCFMYYFNPENSLDPFRKRGWQWIMGEQEYEDYIKFLTRKAGEDVVTARQALPLQVMDKLEAEEGGRGLQVVLDEVALWNFDDESSMMQRHSVTGYTREQKLVGDLHALQYSGKKAEEEEAARAKLAKALSEAVKSSREDCTKPQWEIWLKCFAEQVIFVRQALPRESYDHLDQQQLHAVCILTISSSPHARLRVSSKDTVRAACAAVIRIKRLLSRMIYPHLSPVAMCEVRFQQADAPFQRLAADPAACVVVVCPPSSCMPFRMRLTRAWAAPVLFLLQIIFAESCSQAQERGADEPDADAGISALLLRACFNPPVIATPHEIRMCHTLTDIGSLLARVPGMRQETQQLSATGASNLALTIPRSMSGASAAPQHRRDLTHWESFFRTAYVQPMLVFNVKCSAADAPATIEVPDWIEWRQTHSAARRLGVARLAYPRALWSQLRSDRTTQVGGMVDALRESYSGNQPVDYWMSYEPSWKIKDLASQVGPRS